MVSCHAAAGAKKRARLRQSKFQVQKSIHTLREDLFFENSLDDKDISFVGSMKMLPGQSRIILRAFRVARSALLYTGWMNHALDKFHGRQVRPTTADAEVESHVYQGLRSDLVLLERLATSLDTEGINYRDERSKCTKTIITGTSACPFRKVSLETRQPC